MGSQKKAPLQTKRWILDDLRKLGVDGSTLEFMARIDKP